MENIQLYRTNILLGGQLKYDLIVNNGSIDDVYITPVSSRAPSGGMDKVLLDTDDNLTNIKTFYTKTRSTFYNTYIDPILGSSTLIDPTMKRKNYDDSTLMGCRRSPSYKRYGKQFEFFVPLWIEVPGAVEFYVGYEIDGIKTMMSSPIRFSDAAKGYFDRYFTAVFGSDNDSLVNINLRDSGVDSPYVSTIHGIDVSSGRVTTVRDNTILAYNFLDRERTVIETDSLILDTMKSKHIIAKQLHNFNLCFNPDDIPLSSIDKGRFEKLSFKGVRFFVDVYVGGAKLECKDFYTNYTTLPKSSAPILIYNNGVLEKASSYDRIRRGEEAYQHDHNIYNYLLDNRCIDLVDKNTIEQKYFHWSMVKSNDCIFNLYNGFAGMKQYSTTPALDSADDIAIYTTQYSHYNGASINPYAVSRSDQNNTTYWCSYVNNLTDALLAHSRKIDFYGAASPIKNNYINGLLYDKPIESFIKDNSEIKEFRFMIIEGYSSALSMPTIRNYLRATRPGSGEIYSGPNTSGDIQYIYTLQEKIMHVFIISLKEGTSEAARLTYKTMIDGLREMLEPKDRDLAPELKSSMKSILFGADDKSGFFSPNNLVNLLEIHFHRSLGMAHAAGPSDDVDEIFYYKIDKEQYIYRYDGPIKPTFISPDSIEVYNMFYTHRVESLLEPTQETKEGYLEYLRRGYEPRYPSIDFFPLKRSHIDYEEVNDGMVVGEEYKWFNNGLVLNLPDTLMMEIVNDGTKTPMELFREHISSYIDPGEGVEEKIEFVVGMYDVVSDINVADDVVSDINVADDVVSDINVADDAVSDINVANDIVSDINVADDIVSDTLNYIYTITATLK